MKGFARPGRSKVNRIVWEEFETLFAGIFGSVLSRECCFGS